MLVQIHRIHRSLLGYLFYPALISSLLSFGLYAGRVYLSDSWIVYRNLAWNLALAWAPYIFCVWTARLHARYRRGWWRLLFPGLLWLLFFPNAPYLLTDFLHLQERPFVPLWYDIMLLAAFAWTGCFLGVASLRIMHRIVQSYTGKWVSWLFVAAAITASGVGVYLGRFSRWNSWDFLFQPEIILAELAGKLSDPLNNLRFIGFTLSFIAFLSVCYLTFLSMHSIYDPDSSKT